MTFQAAMVYFEEGKPAGYLLASDSYAETCIGGIWENTITEKSIQGVNSIALLRGTIRGTKPVDSVADKVGFSALSSGMYGTFDDIMPGADYSQTPLAQNSEYVALVALARSDAVQLYTISNQMENEKNIASLLHSMTPSTSMDNMFLWMANGKKYAILEIAKQFSKVDAIGFLEDVLKTQIDPENHPLPIYFYDVSFKGIKRFTNQEFASSNFGDLATRDITSYLFLENNAIIPPPEDYHPEITQAFRQLAKSLGVTPSQIKPYLTDEIMKLSHEIDLGMQDKQTSYLDMALSVFGLKRIADTLQPGFSYINLCEVKYKGEDHVTFAKKKFELAYATSQNNSHPETEVHLIKLQDNSWVVEINSIPFDATKKMVSDERIGLSGIEEIVANYFAH